MEEQQRPSAGLKYEPAGSGPQRAIGATVLVVDDDAEMTRLIAAVLASRGLATVSAFDATQGFLAAQRLQPRFILVDWHMPAGGGLQLLRQLHAYEGTVGIPVVVVTGDGSPAIQEEAVALGARGVLYKPIDTAHFAELVNTLVA